LHSRTFLNSGLLGSLGRNPGKNVGFPFLRLLYLAQRFALAIARGQTTVVVMRIGKGARTLSPLEALDQAVSTMEPPNGIGFGWYWLEK
jgi:hypothetical protein